MSDDTALMLPPKAGDVHTIWYGSALALAGAPVIQSIAGPATMYGALNKELARAEKGEEIVIECNGCSIMTSQVHLEDGWKGEREITLFLPVGVGRGNLLKIEVRKEEISPIQLVVTHGRRSKRNAAPAPLEKRPPKKARTAVVEE